MNPPEEKPSITALEASWHQHIAGQRAAEAARLQGANPAAVGAVAGATAGPVIIAGMRLQPASQGTIWTLQRTAREFAAYADAEGWPAPSSDPAQPGTRELIELGLTTLIFCDARSIWRALDSDGLPELVERAKALIWEMPLADNLALQAHFQAQMQEIAILTGGGEAEGDAGKKQPPVGGVSPESPTPPRARDLPPSSGWPQNTGSRFPRPSGGPR